MKTVSFEKFGRALDRAITSGDSHRIEKVLRKMVPYVNAAQKDNNQRAYAEKK